MLRFTSGRGETHSAPYVPSAVSRGQSSHLCLMTLIPLRQPIRALGVIGRPALATRYLPNMCRGLLPSPINSPGMEGGRAGIRGKNNSPNYNSQEVGDKNSAYGKRVGGGPRGNVRMLGFTHIS